MKSMTGYGCGIANDAEKLLQIQVEISSVNRKTLDVNVSCPREWNGLDQACKLWIKDTFHRGRLNILIKIESSEENMSAFGWSAESMDTILDQLRNYAQSRNLPFQVDSHLLFNLAKTIKDNIALPHWNELSETIRIAFDSAVEKSNNMRTKEGVLLAQDLLQRIQILDAFCKQIVALSKTAVVDHHARLMDRLKQLRLDLDVNDERVLKEIALFADRCDISEEITRLNSHFEHFREFIHAQEPTGRKMDFLCQEINRELNTIGSKVTVIESTRTVIEAKNELERIREQVQNIE